MNECCLTCEYYDYPSQLCISQFENRESTDTCKNYKKAKE
jgi:hypothetical protein